MENQAGHNMKIDEVINFQDKEVKKTTTTVDKFKPTQDYLVILIPKIEKKTKSGILKTERQVQEELAEVPQVFEVVSTGEKVTGINVGQYVLCTRINQVPVTSNKEGFEVAVVRMFDIIGVFDSI